MKIQSKGWEHKVVCFRCLHTAARRASGQTLSRHTPRPQQGFKKSENDRIPRLRILQTDLYSEPPHIETKRRCEPGVWGAGFLADGGLCQSAAVSLVVFGCVSCIPLRKGGLAALSA